MTGLTDYRLAKYASTPSSSPLLVTFYFSHKKATLKGGFFMGEIKKPPLKVA
ncbi:hypothetical protein Q7276_08315 [Glaesserella parasuis]|nr:hypothetical protein [Glaesserella parasuis]